MRITALVENTSARPELIAEHALSLYIESNGYKILFDMGASDAFVQNAKVLGIDLNTVDFAVLSHGHYDHGGGMARSCRKQKQDGAEDARTYCLHPVFL